jgi:hypothetical protein
MKKLMIALGVVMLALPVYAGNVDFTFGAERKLQAETNAMYLDTTFSFLGFTVTDGINYDVDNGLDTTFNSFELDISRPLTDKLTMYVNNDFDIHLDHTETTTGFKISF